jgi:hypothetical protein
MSVKIPEDDNEKFETLFQKVNDGKVLINVTNQENNEMLDGRMTKQLSSALKNIIFSDGSMEMMGNSKGRWSKNMR